ncbi:MAG: hypothetical protein ACXVGR_11680 [Mycobacteriaceae bacterium]
MTKSGAKNRPAGPSTADERVNTVDLMAKGTENQRTTDTQTTTENQGTTGNQSTDLPAPGGNPDNRETVQNMGAPELRNAVIELLTIIDDSDDMDVVVTISDDGTVVVEAA